MPEEQINVNVSVDDSVAVGIKAPEMINYTPVSVTVGTTTTLDAGESATVTNSGDQYDAVLNFGIPKGDKGDSGKSAYESAVDGGYTGTEAEFEQALASDIGTVAGIASDVTQVAGIASAVSNVAANESNVTLVSDNMASVMATAGSIGDVNTVAGIASSVSAVAGDSTNISAVAADLSNIDTAATNISAIIAAPTAASNAATSATNAQTWAEGTDVQVAALGGTKSSKGWAARAEELVQSIGQVMHYKGSVATYSALEAITDADLGDVYNVLADDSNYAWTGSAWDMIGSSVDISGLQPKTLATPISVGGVSQTTVEGALGAINTETTKGLKNTATGTNSITILGTAATATAAINIGKNSKAQGNYGVAIGNEAWTSDSSTVAIGAQANALDYYAIAIGGYVFASKMYSIALGYSASASANYAIQLGEGTNSTANTMQVWTYPLLNKSTGKIPAARLTDMVGADGVNAGTAGAVPAPTATDNTKFLRGDGTWAEAGGGSVSSPTLTWYTGQTGTTLTILDTSAAVCVKVYKNGVLLQPTQDYSIAGTTLTLTTALVATDKIIIEDSTMLDGSSLSNVVRSNDVAHIVRRTQAEYDALVEAGTVSATTFYIIVN